MQIYSHMTRRSFVTGAAALSAAAALAATQAGSAFASSGAKDSGASSSSSSSNAASSTADAGAPDLSSHFDVVIVGAGGAGMTAALSAQEGGAKVLLLEKMSITGGNTNYAEGGMNACCTKIQEQEGIEDSVELFASDTYAGGHDKGNMELITFMCENSNAALERLNERGMHLTRLGRSGGASVKRIHRPEDGSAVGSYLTTRMAALCAERGVAPINDMKVEEILVKDGAVCGVRATAASGEEYSIEASAVIVSAGGFGANHQMLAQYRPELLEAVTTNHPGATGDGIAMATAIGAGTVDMGEIQVHPTVEQSTSLLLSEGIRGDGAILVNQNGERFINELLTRDVVSAAEWEQPGGWSYAVFDQPVADANTSIEEKFVARDLVLVADSLKELAAQMDTNADAFLKTVEDYNSAIASGADDPLERTASREPIEKAPFYAVKVAPGIHHTMGGLRINSAAEVLDKNGTAIPGLFAAGEVTGGIHGGNRLGGNAVCDINVFGHQAAVAALAYLGK